MAIFAMRRMLVVMMMVMALIMIMMMIVMMMGFLGRWHSGGPDRVIAAYKQLANLTTSS